MGQQFRGAAQGPCKHKGYSKSRTPHNFQHRRWMAARHAVRAVARSEARSRGTRSGTQEGDGHDGDVVDGLEGSSRRSQHDQARGLAGLLGVHLAADATQGLDG